MSQLSRLKSAEISDGNVIYAADIEAEFDQLVTESNSQDTRLTDIESNALTIAGVKTFSSTPKMDSIAEKTSAAGVTVDGLLIKDNGITATDVSELTIATGAITVTGMCHTVDTEADAASDDLDTISGGTDGRIIRLMAENDARTVVLKHNTGNIYIPSGVDISLDNAYSSVLLQYVGALSKWVPIDSATLPLATTATTITGTNTTSAITPAGLNGFLDDSGFLKILDTSGTAAASATFGNIFNATQELYLAHIYFEPATDGAFPWLRVTTGGGTPVASGTPYRYCANNSASDDATVGNGSGAASTGANQMVLERLGIGNAAQEAFDGWFLISSPGNTSRYTKIWGICSANYTSGLVSFGVSSNQYTSTTAVDGLYLQASTGNMDVYEIQVWQLGNT